MATEKKMHENSLANLKPFTKTYRPKNTGRKPSQLKKYIKDNNMCREDVALIIKNVLFSKSSDELVYMVQDKSEPMIVRLMVRAYLEDFKKGGLVNLSVLLDRAFGSPKQDVEVSGNVTVTEMTYEEREAKINEYISKSIRITCQGAATLPIEQLVEFQGNLKKLSKKNLEKLKARILEDGFNVPFFVWDHDGVYSLLDGHQRTRALASLRADGYVIPALPVAYIEASDIADARKKLLAISSQYGEFDADELAEWMNGLDDGIADTLRIVDGELVLNIDQEEKEAAIRDADPRMQEAERLRVKWGTEKGQLWQLGGHRIMCGDSTIPAQVEFLMGKDLADMAFTDPPYGVSYVGVNNPNGSAWTMIENDDLRGDTLVQFLVAAFTNMYNTLKINTAIYVWYASSTHIQFETALNAAGFEVKEQLIWNKGMVLGHSDYHWAHEPMLYCRKKDQKTTWYGDRTNKTILRAKRTDLAKLKKEEPLQIVKNLMDESTNWEIDRDSIKTYMHPTQKPTALAYRAIVNSSDDGAIVQDLFSGSGTTLVACENCNRKARVMEFDPGYVAVAIERWHEVTGEMPEIIGVIDEEQTI